jgi:hypothetical protein
MSKSPSRHWTVAGIVFLVLGLLLVAFSFLLPALDNGSSEWSNDKALQYQQTAERIHQLSGSPSGLPNAADRQALLEAQEEHDRLDKERRQAVDSAAWRAAALRWTGILLTLLGIAIHTMNRAKE